MALTAALATRRQAFGLAWKRGREVAAKLSVAHRFAIFCTLILVAGALIIGSWVSREIERRVIERTAAVTALYVDSSVRPHLAGLKTGSISADERTALSSLIAETPLGREIVSFKVWSGDGRILFARDEGLVGQRFPISRGLAAALSGSVSSHLSSLSDEENRRERAQWPRLVETYSPVRSVDGEVVGAVEFYQLPADLLSQATASQRQGWLIVAGSTAAMYLLLVGLVANASRTITRQNRGLQVAFQEQKALQSRIRSLNQRLRRAAGAKTQTDEELSRRLARDLHDGPGQDLSLALLRLEELQWPEAPPGEHSALATIRSALRHALDDVRALSTGLRLPQLDGMGWRSVVEKAAKDHEGRTGATVHVQAQEIDPLPSPPQRIAAYRVIQEALSNASRHSGADEQWLSLSNEGGWALISITDRGRGFDVRGKHEYADRRARLGLQVMRERVELLGGTLSVQSSKGHGTNVVARIPLEPDHER